MSEFPSAKVEEQVRSLPDKPGVYRYYDANNALLYIGKAKSLIKRVSSYFNAKQASSARIKLMVSKIRQLEFTVVASEFEALLLENTLIKKHQPKYNINLKDAKTYPYLTIKNEDFPRLFTIRNRVNDGSEYYGPYSSIQRMKVILDVLKKTFPLRSCNFLLSEANIKSGKFNTCLDYQIGLCKGPCEGLQSKDEYDENISKIRDVLKGNFSPVLQYLKQQLQDSIESLEFEKAEEWKNKLDLMENFSSKSTVVNPKIHNVDVFSIYSYNQYAFVNYLKVINGAIIQTHTVELKKKLDESDEELLLLSVAEIRSKFNSRSKEVLLPISVDFEGGDIDFTTPKIGDKKKLIELSYKNAIAYAQQKMKVIEVRNPQKRTDELLKRMQSDLQLKELPKHIECFDNSNMQGSFPVSSCVVFKNAKPSKADYRIFNVKTVDQIDDFATMFEVVTRRYSRLLEEGEALPQLIVIDGGKGQLGMAVKALQQVGVFDKIEVVGIAKRLEEIYKPGDPIPLHVDRTSDSLKIIQQLRNEAHRFAITHHRSRRLKSNFTSELENIEGIGKKTATELLRKFKSVKKIKAAKSEEISELIGKVKTENLLNYFKNKSN